MPRPPGSTAPGRRLRRRGPALVLALGLLTACGGEGGDASGDAGTTAPEAAATETSPTAPEGGTASPTPAEAETVTATEGNFYIELSEDSFTAGSYTFEVANEGGATHNFVVERDGADVAATEPISPGGTATLTVTLEPGEYVFYCSIGTHRAMGMELTVQVG